MLRSLRYFRFWGVLLLVYIYIYIHIYNVGSPSYKLVYNPIYLWFFAYHKPYIVVIVVINQLSYLGGPTLYIWFGHETFKSTATSKQRCTELVPLPLARRISADFSRRMFFLFELEPSTHPQKGVKVSKRWKNVKVQYLYCGYIISSNFSRCLDVLGGPE